MPSSPKSAKRSPGAEPPAAPSGPLAALGKALGDLRRDGYARLPQLKSFEAFLTTQTARLRLEASTPALARLIKSLATGAPGFDSADHKSRCRRVEEWCSLLDAAMGTPASAPNPQPPSPIPPTGGLDTPVQFLKGVGPKRALALEAKGIRTVEDLLYYFPRTYRNLGDIRRINTLEVGETVTLMGRVLLSGEVRLGRSGRRLFEVIVSDASGQLSLKWFNYPPTSLKERFKKGAVFFITGKVGRYHTQREMHHPETELVDEDGGTAAPTGYQPIYSLPEGWSAVAFRKAITGWVADYAEQITDPLPSAILEEHGWPTKAEAVRQLHRPPETISFADLETQRSPAHQRLIFEEFLLLQIAMGRRQQERKKVSAQAIVVEDSLVDGFLAQLPFALTNAQRRVFGEIRTDMSRPSAMHRLVQGDVGSGKTAVAFLAARLAIATGGQAALMAPTELLAEQHARTLRELGAKAGITVGLLTGSMPASDKRALRTRIEAGQIPLVAGTHALIQEDVNFKNLRLAIVDEQHRFGVDQRAKLQEKGEPHTLVMTATPIPRTLAMTVYGDLDVSVIDELPPGRTPVRTKVVYEKSRNEMYAWIRTQLAAGRQAYFVYPLVAESEKVDLKDATQMAAHLAGDVFPGHALGLLHGQMRPEEKDEVMKRFKSGELRVLVATTVIEVGIDVPNASVMVVEHAERFGLSQLHQLRGRVGRGAAQSHCLLMVDYASTDEARFRLSTMEETTDGFKIAEADLELRGPGELLGRRQSGLPEFRLGNLVRDAALLSEARNTAWKLLEHDPELKAHPGLGAAMRKRWEDFRLAAVG